MNYTVDFLLKCVSEEQAFCLFMHALRNHHLGCLYETQLPILSQFMEIYERQLLLRCPRLATFLQSREFLAPFYSIEWFTTAWVLASPATLTLAIWDLLLFGFKVRLLINLFASHGELIYTLTLPSSFVLNGMMKQKPTMQTGYLPAMCRRGHGGARIASGRHGFRGSAQEFSRSCTGG
jgi:hypothetical protein